MKNSKKNNNYIPAEGLFGKENASYVWVGWGMVIKQLRQFIDVDQEIFGRLLYGYTRMQISRYEKEQAEPPIDFWIKVTKMFGLNLSWALTGIGVPYIEDFKDSEERVRFIKWSILIDEKINFLNELRGDYEL